MEYKLLIPLKIINLILIIYIMNNLGGGTYNIW